VVSLARVVASEGEREKPVSRRRLQGNHPAVRDYGLLQTVQTSSKIDIPACAFVFSSRDRVVTSTHAVVAIGVLWIETNRSLGFGKRFADSTSMLVLFASLDMLSGLENRVIVSSALDLIE